MRWMDGEQEGSDLNPDVTHMRMKLLLSQSIS